MGSYIRDAKTYLRERTDQKRTEEYKRIKKRRIEDNARSRQQREICYPEGIKCVNCCNQVKL
jgi:hypothetical protein